MNIKIELEIENKNLKISSENAPKRFYPLDRWEIGSAVENYLCYELDENPDLKLKNNVSGEIMDFWDSYTYYIKDISDDSGINDIYDLCEYLNHLDMYGCGSSFEIVEEHWKNH